MKSSLHWNGGSIPPEPDGKPRKWALNPLFFTRIKIFNGI
jgi:hypothetical protein